MEYTPETPMQPNKNKMALWSMIMGITAWVLFIISACFNWIIVPALGVVTAGLGFLLYLCLIPVACISPIAWILAVIFGHVGKKQIRTTGESGSGMATAGLIMGYIGVALIVLSLCAIVILAATGGLAGVMEMFNSGYYY